MSENVEGQIMRKSRWSYALQVLVMTTGILFGYNNCSEKSGFAVNELPPTESEHPESPEGPPNPEVLSRICESDLEKIYRVTFFPILSANCSSCHQHSQGHGSADPHESYLGFKAIGLARIQEITDPLSPGAHDARFNKILVDKKIEDQLESWNHGATVYQSCLSAIHHGVVETKLDLLTQLVSVNLVERPGVGMTAQWKKIEFDLENPRNSREKNKVPAIFSIEISYYLVGENSNSLGFKLRNPRLKLKNQDIQVNISQGLRLRVEGRILKTTSSQQSEVKEIEISQFSPYLNLQKVVTSSSETLIIEDRFKDVETIVPFPGFDSLFDRLSFYFENIDAADIL